MFAVCKLRSNFEIIIVYWEGNNKTEFPFNGTFVWIIFIYCATIVAGMNAVQRIVDNME